MNMDPRLLDLNFLTWDKFSHSNALHLVLLIFGTAVARRLKPSRAPGGGGYCHIWVIWVCAAGKGMVFRQFTLGQGI